jgi:flagellar protein FlaF
MSGRETEARVLTKAALLLRECQQNWELSLQEGKLDAALRYNQKVWSIFQGELANENHPLQKKLRLDLLRLSAFVDKRIFETMAFPSPEKLDIVIRINENIAAGLRTRSPKDETNPPLSELFETDQGNPKK